MFKGTIGEEGVDGRLAEYSQQKTRSCDEAVDGSAAATAGQLLWASEVEYETALRGHGRYDRPGCGAKR